MSSVNGKSVKYAKLNGTIFIGKDVGQIGPELVSSQTAVHKAFTLTIDEPFLMVESKDKVGNPVHVPVPLSYVTHMVLAEAPTKSKY